MNGLPYYKAYPRDFIEGTIGMPFEIKCAYRVVLDMIYMQDGALPDDDRYISGLLGCSLRKWKSIRNHLIEAGKIYVNGEFLSNYRADSELETLAKLQERQRENRRGSNKNKGLQKPRSDHTESEPESEIDTDAKASASMDADDVLQNQGFRERLLVAMGVDPVSGLNGPGGKMIGTLADMQMAKAWISDLGLSEDECVQTVAEVRARMNGPPGSFRYFDGPMQNLAGLKAKPKLEPSQQPERRQANGPTPHADATLESIARAARAR